MILLREGENFNNDSLCVKKKKEFFHGLGASLKDWASQENNEMRISDERVQRGRTKCHRGKNKEHGMGRFHN